MWSERVYTEAVKRTAGLNKKRDVLQETVRIIRRKNMKVLMINGSPHKEGNTYIALKEMEKIFSEEVNRKRDHTGGKQTDPGMYGMLCLYGEGAVCLWRLRQ